MAQLRTWANKIHTKQGDEMTILSLYMCILRNIKCTYFFVGLLWFSNIFLVVEPFLLIKVYLYSKKGKNALPEAGKR